MEFVDLQCRHNWVSPAKKIFTHQDLAAFHNSAAFIRLCRVILVIAKAISNTEIPQSEEPTAAASAICSILADLESFQEEAPPIEGPKRYGNPAAREWHSKVESRAVDLVKHRLSSYLPAGSAECDDFLKESIPYLLNSFGSATRLDYGTGHELSFVAWLGALFMTGVLPVDTSGSQLLLVLQKYYGLVKKLILVYTLEPAGSHGVWGLDDHFHLSYLFGACQMIDYQSVFPPIESLNGSYLNGSDSNQVQETVEFTTPRSATKSREIAPLPSYTLQSSVVDQLKDRNLYFGSLSFLFEVKKAPFYEHSPILYNIGSAKTWEKVARGLWRMYSDEVLGKWPVVQHFWFGKVLYPWVSASSVIKSYKASEHGSFTYDYGLEFVWKELNSSLGQESDVADVERSLHPSLISGSRARPSLNPKSHTFTRR